MKLNTSSGPCGAWTTTVDDVRQALYEIYTESCPNQLDMAAKPQEGALDVYYDNWWVCGTKDQFMRPYLVTVYAYAVGPYRLHIFRRGPVEKNDQHEWVHPDPLTKALEVIRQWKPLESNIEHPEGSQPQQGSPPP